MLWNDKKLMNFRNPNGVAVRCFWGCFNPKFIPPLSCLIFPPEKSRFFSAQIARISCYRFGVRVMDLSASGVLQRCGRRQFIRSSYQPPFLKIFREVLLSEKVPSSKARRNRFLLGFSEKFTNHFTIKWFSETKAPPSKARKKKNICGF